MLEWYDIWPVNYVRLSGLVSNRRKPTINLLNFSHILIYVNPQTYKQSQAPTVVRELLIAPSAPLGFCCVTIFRRDLVENL